jgi:hypothetical protein
VQLKALLITQLIVPVFQTGFFNNALALVGIKWIVREMKSLRFVYMIAKNPGNYFLHVQLQTPTELY